MFYLSIIIGNSFIFEIKLISKTIKDDKKKDRCSFSFLIAEFGKEKNGEE